MLLNYFSTMNLFCECLYVLEFFYLLSEDGVLYCPIFREGDQVTESWHKESELQDLRAFLSWKNYIFTKNLGFRKKSLPKLQWKVNE